MKKSETREPPKMDEQLSRDVRRFQREEITGAKLYALLSRASKGVDLMARVLGLTFALKLLVRQIFGFSA